MSCFLQLTQDITKEAISSEKTSNPMANFNQQLSLGGCIMTWLVET